MYFNNNSNSHKSLPALLILSIFMLFIFVSTSFSADQESIEAVRQMGKAFSSVASQASPAVVGLRTERIVSQSNFNNDFYEYFFGGPQRRSPRRPPQQQQQQPQRQEEQAVTETQGSGFLISADGYILTNNHMVEI